MGASLRVNERLLRGPSEGQVQDLSWPIGQLMVVLYHQDQVARQEGEENIITLKGTSSTEIGPLKCFKGDPPGRFRHQ